MPLERKMDLRSSSRFGNLLRQEVGQTATEYALVAFWTVIIVLVSIEALQAALLDGYQGIATLISLPIP